MLHIHRGEYLVIRVDGTETLIQEKPTMRAIQNAIKCYSLDTVILDRRNRQIMMCDDTGMLDGKPVNAKATEAYHAICRPGTIHCIHGDVVIVHDGDFS